jgi:purine nucleoside phosphorylase
MKIGIIAGTGFYNLPALAGSTPQAVDTVYGKALITSGKWHGAEIAFLTRHGVDHSVPPSAVNYRANITALKSAGVDFVIARVTLCSADNIVAACSARCVVGHDPQGHAADDEVE